MSNALDVYHQASTDLTALMAELNVLRPVQSSLETGSAQHGTESSAPHGVANGPDLILPMSISPNVLNEIPRHDKTYTELSTVLIPHPRHENIFLLEYCSFDGVKGFQPCAKDIDRSGIFNSLQALEVGGDHVFKVARAWSCVNQARESLPKDVRWVLAAIYNFSSEMLRGPKRDEDRLWQMRPWLMYWYDVADKLFVVYDICASAPATDWFLRPAEEPSDDPSEYSKDVLWDRCYTHSAPPSMTETVVHHVELSRGSTGVDN